MGMTKRTTVANIIADDIIADDIIADAKIARLAELSIDLDLAIGVGNGVLLVSLDTYKNLVHNNQIDFVPDGHGSLPLFYGRRIIVPGWWNTVATVMPAVASVIVRSSDGSEATIENLADVDAEAIYKKLAEVNVALDLANTKGGTHLIVTVEAYKKLLRNNLIDYIHASSIEPAPYSNDETLVPMIFGRRVFVPGTVFAK